MVVPDTLPVIGEISVAPSPAPASEIGQAVPTDLPRVPRDKTKLKRVLPQWQILMIAIGGVIGITIFSTDGEILNTAGPAGLLTALAFVAATTIFVMECIAEFVVMWPVSNAMIEYVKAFVDRDLAIVIGIAYWYTMSSVFATLILTASDFSSYWISEQIWRTILFFVGVPLFLLGINCLGVKYYGWIEGIGGIVKLLMVASGAIFMMIDAGKTRSTNINDNYRHQADETRNSAVAVCMSIPLLAYGFIGVEIVSVTAFEAQRRESLRFPARWVSYIITAIYVACALLEAVVVGWDTPCLPTLDAQKCPLNVEQGSSNAKVVARADEGGPGFVAVIVLAARQYGSNDLGWYFNACIIYFCLSAANTALYVASRTLFGLTRGINRMDHPPWYLKPLGYLGITSPFAEVPHWALIVSTVAFFWLPFLQLRKNYSITDLLVIMSTTSSVGGVIVWGSQCVAYIRYHHWFYKHKNLNQLPAKYDRWEPQPKFYPWHKNRTFMAAVSPVPAWLGLIGCFFIVFVFSTANWWNGTIGHPGDKTFQRVATAYAGPMVLSVIFVALKLWNWRGWVKLGTTREDLFAVTNAFEMNSGLVEPELVVATEMVEEPHDARFPEQVP